MELNDKYLVALRRELTRAQARLKRAELERDRLGRENQRLKLRLDRVSLQAKPQPEQPVRSRRK